MSNTLETLANNFTTLLEAEANQLNFTKNEIHDVLKGNEDDLEKTIILFNFIKMKIKWNGITGIEPLKRLENAYLSGSGNIADINLSLLKLLRSAGIDASPVLLNTRDSELKSELTNNEFNYIICSVNINDSQILLDASDDFSSPNTLPERALVKKGLIVEYNGNQKIINLVPVKPSNKLITINAKVHPDHSVKGSIKTNLTDYFASDFLENYSSRSESEIIKEYERNYKGLNAYSYKHHIEYDFSNSITQSFQFSSDNLSNKSAGKLYISPLLFLANETNPFKDSYRQYPIDFKYPFNTEFKVNIIFPQDFEIESLPRNELLKLDELGAEFTYFLRSIGNVVELYMSLKQNKTIVSIEDYKKLREYYEAIHKKRKEVITLSINNYGSKRSSKNSK